MGYSPDNQTLFYLIIVAVILNFFVSRWYFDKLSKKQMKVLVKKINSTFDDYAVRQQPKKQSNQQDSIADPVDNIDTE